MFPEGAQSFFINALGFMSALFIFVIGIGVLVIIGMYIADVTQKKQAITRLLGGSDTGSNIWASFSVSIFLPWIAKSYRLTGQSDLGDIALPRIWTTRWLLGRRVISGHPALSYSSTVPFQP